MQKYFVSPTSFADNQVTIRGDDAKHLVKVMRSVPGDRFIASDGQEREVLAEIQNISQNEVTADVIEHLPQKQEPAFEVWVAQSLPKADKMDTIVQKCTELGAKGFIPFTSMHTIVQYDPKKEQKRSDRWRKIAKEAAEQSRRNRVPLVERPSTVAAVCERISEFDLALFLYEKESAQGLKANLRRWREEGSALLRLLIIAGPEGGFAAQEARAFTEHGAVPTGLGPRILRAETAAMAALSCVLYEFDELEG